MKEVRSGYGSSVQAHEDCIKSGHLYIDRKYLQMAVTDVTLARMSE
jgi:hypothetical protein